MNNIEILIGIVFSISSISCGVPENLRKFDKIDFDLLPFFENYELKVQEKFNNPNLNALNDLSAGFSGIENSEESSTRTIGLCRIFYSGHAEIEIDSEYWSTATVEQKEAVIFHEATHCICNRGHTHEDGQYPEASERTGVDINWSLEEKLKNGYFKDNCPTSLMHPTVPSQTCLERYSEHYRQEMLNGCDLTR